MARRATIGLDGNLRFSLNIPVRVGRGELVAAISYFRPNKDDALPVNRTEAKRLARDFLAKFGTDGTNGYHNLPEVSPSRVKEVRTHIDELFDELVETDDD